MKNIYKIIILISQFANAQSAGINTFDPKATLEVVGNPNDVNEADGIIGPRLTLIELNAKDHLYLNEQISAMVYITDVTTSSSTTSNTRLKAINTIGYYYWDGTIWRPLDTKAGSVIFEAQRTSNVTINRYGFTTVPLTESKNIGGGIFNSSNSTYKIPVSGTYLITSNIKVPDGTAPNNIFQAVNNNNVDIPEGVWQTTPGTPGSKWNMPYSRIAYLTEGQEMRLYVYGDPNSITIEQANLKFILITPNG